VGGGSRQAICPLRRKKLRSYGRLRVEHRKVVIALAKNLSIMWGGVYRITLAEGLRDRRIRDACQATLPISISPVCQFAYSNLIYTTSLTLISPTSHFTCLPIYLIQFRLFNFIYIPSDKTISLYFISGCFSLHFYKTCLILDKYVTLYFMWVKTEYCFLSICSNRARLNHCILSTCSEAVIRKVCIHIICLF
jgi:hypothetical protein